MEGLDGIDPAKVIMHSAFDTVLTLLRTEPVSEISYLFGRFDAYLMMSESLHILGAEEMKVLSDRRDAIPAERVASGVDEVQSAQTPPADGFFSPPYVRNGPLLVAAERRESQGAITLIGAGGSGLEIRAIGQFDVQSAGAHLALSWNFHDPLVDVLRAVVEAGDASALDHARKVLGAIKAREKK